MRKPRLFALTLAAVLAVALTACSSDDDGDPGSQTSPQETTQGDAQAEVETEEQAAVLAEFDLEDKSPQEIVDHLDRLGFDERPGDLIASVRPQELQIIHEDEEFALDLADAGFYLSFAPYVEQTHDCYFHSLTTCVGELGGEEIEVTITDADGQELVNETVTIFDNGFYGVWLDHDIEGTLEVTYGDYSGEVPFATGPDDATCVATLQLT